MNKREQDRLALARLADTYWEESIIPIQIRIREINVMIKNEPSAELRKKLRDRRRYLNRILSELQITAIHLDQYYRKNGGEE